MRVKKIQIDFDFDLIVKLKKVELKESKEKK